MAIEVKSSGSSLNGASVMDFFDIYIPVNLLDQLEEKIRAPISPVNGLINTDDVNDLKDLKDAVHSTSTSLYNNGAYPIIPDRIGYKRYLFEKVNKFKDFEFVTSYGIPIKYSAQKYIPMEVSNRLFRYKYTVLNKEPRTPAELEYFKSYMNYPTLTGGYLFSTEFIKRFGINKNEFAARGGFKDTGGSPLYAGIVVPILIARNGSYNGNAPNGVEVHVTPYDIVELDPMYSEETDDGYVKRKVSAIGTKGVNIYSKYSGDADAVQKTLKDMFVNNVAVGSDISDNSGFRLLWGKDYDGNSEKIEKLSDDSGSPKLYIGNEMLLDIRDIYMSGNDCIIEIKRIGTEMERNAIDSSGISVPGWYITNSIKIDNSPLISADVSPIKESDIIRISSGSTMIGLSSFSYVNPFVGIKYSENLDPTLPIFNGAKSEDIKDLMARNKTIYDSNALDYSNTYEGQFNYYKLHIDRDKDRYYPYGYSYTTFKPSLCGNFIKKDKMPKGSFMIVNIMIYYNSFDHRKFMEKLQDNEFAKSGLNIGYANYIDSVRYNSSIDQLFDVFGFNINFKAVGGNVDQ